VSNVAQGPRFAVGSAIFGFEETEDLEPWVRLVSAAGFPGIELYPHSIPRRYYQRPGELRDLFDDHGLKVVTVSNGASVTRTSFLDPAARKDTIADHLALARDLLAVLGCEHFKINVGSRPPGGPSDSDLQNLATTLNELGRATADVGVKLAPHPHIWGPMERPEEIVRIMREVA
jgi:inosose dehydratase